MSTNSQCPPTPITTNVRQRKRQFQSNFRPALPPICIVIADIDHWWTLSVGDQSRHPAMPSQVPLVPTVPQVPLNPHAKSAKSAKKEESK